MIGARSRSKGASALNVEAFLGAAALIGVAAVAAAEVWLRRCGFIDFPLYDADPVLGYVPKPNTRGRLFNRADWAFNELSMGVAEPFRATSPSTLLVGDSLVFTSAQIPQARKLGPLLQARLGHPVWPIGAGSWALQNELAWLHSHPQALACDTVVVIVNSGDFQDASVWRDPLMHPRRRPRSALWFLVRKKLHKPYLPPFAYPTPEQEAEWGGSLDRFLAAYKGRVIFVLYPNKPEIETGEDKFGPIRRRLAGRAEILDVRPHWRAEYFLDWTHPTERAYPLLAELIAAKVEEVRRAA